MLAVALLMASVDQTIVATALPQVQRDLGAEANAAGWIITAYTLGLVLMLPVAGTLGDRYGRKSVFLVAAAVFTAASLACGLVHDLEVLVVLRFVQAIGGGALMPSATGIVVATFGEERDKALGAFSSVFPIGGIVGPLLGGVIVHWLSWRWIFLVNIPLGIGLIVAGAVFVPRIEERRDDDRFDLLGIAMLMGALLAFMMGVSLMSGVDDRPFGLAVLVLSACATCAFFRHTRLRSSFLPRELLVGSRFAVMNVINFLYGSVALGLGVLIPHYAHNRFGMGSLEGGSLMTLRAVGAVIAAIVAIVLLRRFGYR
ncbi:MAG: MFS transporter [Hyphomicrobiaceae bacterium]